MNLDLNELETRIVFDEILQSQYLKTLFENYYRYNSESKISLDLYEIFYFKYSDNVFNKHCIFVGIKNELYCFYEINLGLKYIAEELLFNETELNRLLYSTLRDEYIRKENIPLELKQQYIDILINNSFKISTDKNNDFSKIYGIMLI